MPFGLEAVVPIRDLLRTELEGNGWEAESMQLTRNNKVRTEILQFGRVQNPCM